MSKWKIENQVSKSQFSNFSQKRKIENWISISCFHYEMENWKLGLISDFSIT